MQNVPVDPVLFKIANLEAKFDALQATFFSFVQDNYPDQMKQRFHVHNESYKQLAHEKLWQIPNVDETVVSDIKRQLGL